jgi:superfamily II RNA helicase
VTLEEVPLRFGLVPVIFHWSTGQLFAKIALITDVLEGTIVRCVVRLEEGLRELCHAAKIMGDMELAAKFESSAVSIKRDICFASSLYL